MAGLAIDTIGHLPITSTGNRWALTSICLHTSYVFVILMKEKSVENFVQANLSDILANKGGRIVILGNNGREIKKKVLNEACNQVGITKLFYNPFHLK